MSIKEAIRRGILDADLSTYRCLKTRKSYTIQEAIDEGLLVATIDDPNAPKTEKSGKSIAMHYFLSEYFKALLCFVTMICTFTVATLVWHHLSVGICYC